MSEQASARNGKVKEQLLLLKEAFWCEAEEGKGSVHDRAATRSASGATVPQKTGKVVYTMRVTELYDGTINSCNAMMSGSDREGSTSINKKGELDGLDGSNIVMPIPEEVVSMERDTTGIFPPWQPELLDNPQVERAYLIRNAFETNRSSPVFFKAPYKSEPPARAHVHGTRHEYEHLQCAAERAKRRNGAQAVVQRARDAQRHRAQRETARPGAGVKVVGERVRKYSVASSKDKGRDDKLTENNRVFDSFGCPGRALRCWYWNKHSRWSVDFANLDEGHTRILLALSAGPEPLQGRLLRNRGGQTFLSYPINQCFIFS
ncbi:hypothetical protein EDB85DRAFT_1894726 [Lactarius pseudohatsudake]|nr:hypothetical protein EDB85DRAFT_1894726 [Lactarius pseudohatsudake]